MPNAGSLPVREITRQCPAWLCPVEKGGTRSSETNWQNSETAAAITRIADPGIAAGRRCPAGPPPPGMRCGQMSDGEAKRPGESEAPKRKPKTQDAILYIYINELLYIIV